MSEQDLPPLDADVLALLEEAKPIPALDDRSKDALFAAIATRLPPVPDGGGDGGGGDGGGGALPPGSGTIATTATRAAIALLGTFGIGIAVGVGIDRATLPPPPQVIASSVAVIAPVPSAPPSVDRAGVPVEALPSVRPVVVARPDAGAAPAVSARGLAAERALLDVARGALARGEPGEALAATERHGREYPDGALVEEREAIAIKALVALGRREEAQKRAVAFERKFPNGLMLRAVKSAVDPAP